MSTLLSGNHMPEIRAMDEMFERFFGRNPVAFPTSSALPIDVYDRDGKLMIRASVPGVDPENLEVQVENNVLTLRGEVKSDWEDKEDVKVYRREVSYGSFARSIRLPDNLDLSKIDAEFHNGFVTISIPRMEEARPKSIQVRVRPSEGKPNLPQGSKGDSNQNESPNSNQAG
ncbi:MAG TPA: Hsp20/alpha crystallin family protein [Fimbriimonadaceae bacterium]|nr:Hsp20/alpha crystallin family protein [Fimbriimonadaceae bacterium]